MLGKTRNWPHNMYDAWAGGAASSGVDWGVSRIRTFPRHVHSRLRPPGRSQRWINQAAAAGWLVCACRIGPRKQHLDTPQLQAFALGFALSHIRSIAQLPSNSPGVDDEALIPMERWTPESSVGLQGRGVADDPSPVHLMAARGKALRSSTSSASVSLLPVW